MKRLAILGASGHGKVVADCAQLCGWEGVCFFDDAWPDKHINGHWKIVGDTQALLSRAAEFDGVLIAIGHNATRRAKLQAVLSAGARVPVLVHPSATLSPYASIGAGSVLFAGAVVNVDAQISIGAIINTGATVDHDCVLGEAVHVSPGAHLAGGVMVGNSSWIGVGASVRQLIRIGSDVMVGAGAAVVSDVSDGCTVAGVPAKVLR